MSKSKFKSQLQTRAHRPYGTAIPAGSQEVWAHEGPAGKPIHTGFGVYDPKGREWGIYVVYTPLNIRIEPEYAWGTPEYAEQQTRLRAEGFHGRWYDPATTPVGAAISVYAHVTRDGVPYGASPSGEAFTDPADALAYAEHRVAAARKRYTKRAG